MSVTFNLTSVQVPTPVAPAGLALGPGAGAGSPFYTGLFAGGASSTLNQIVAALALVHQVGAGGYAILAGCAVAVVSGLNVTIAPGIVFVDDVIEFVASSPSGQYGPHQVQVPPPYTLPDNSSNFLWLCYAPTTGITSLISESSHSTIPTNGRICLGYITTLSGAVTATDSSPVISVSGGRFYRQTADVGAPKDSPPSGMNLITLTTTGEYEWGLTTHAKRKQPQNTQSLAGTLTMTPLSPSTNFLTASGGNRTVLLPDPTLMDPGDMLWFQNAGGSNNIVIKDHTNTTTLCTLTPGQIISAGTSIVSSANAFPGSPPWAGGTLTPSVGPP